MQPTNELTTAAATFIAAIKSLSDEQFLAKLDDEWTPRDVVAHLAWWNNNMLVACKDLQRGNAPSYYADTLNDYRTINSQAIAQFSSKERRVLLAQLKSILFEFTEYLASLDAKEWDAAHWVMHPRGGAATISRIVESLIGDYESHTRQIEEWKAVVSKQQSKRNELYCARGR